MFCQIIVEADDIVTSGKVREAVSEYGDEVSDVFSRVTANVNDECGLGGFIIAVFINERKEHVVCSSSDYYQC